MSIETLTGSCNDIFLASDCCHDDGRICSCYDCLGEDYYSRADSYNCQKKLCYYTMNYGPAYASEIYHYLSASQLLEREFNGRSIRVLSLGCGFSPDAYALDRYIDDNNLNITFDYTGYDMEISWNGLREAYQNRDYETRNLLNGFSLAGYDIVFMCKVFSTIKRNDVNSGTALLNILKNEINKMNNGSYFIFNEVNHRDFGRDWFDSEIKNLFSRCTQFYFPIEKAYNGGYIPINNTGNIFEFPDNLAVYPKTYVNKSIIFEYRK
ncbi:hypothetical protein CLHUN_39750 [Ruminiclostridium hungatei]|uniref:Class I SAM-dependent methyltransferase n=1 Tax=Ruminiclostridium hungatei TaxID=48256 RepID=A0A1V4SE98_RUMHU|nr:hypothetical protein [Ruminiclostridium hungatei]OPX42188.1 hypothetical protein CLHUN_39750 [Ruminiclostridium hungatei]